MEKLHFKTNWQYTPFLEGKELEEGDVVNVEFDDGKVLENVTIGIRDSPTTILGSMEIPRKFPFITVDGETIELWNQEIKLCRMR